MRTYLISRRVLLTFTLLIITHATMLRIFYFRYTFNTSDDVWLRPVAMPYGDGQEQVDKIKVAWYNPPVFLTYRPDAMFSGFEGCVYSNCKMSYSRIDASDSEAVIFTGRLIPRNLSFVRPTGQIWIFYEHEPPYRYSEHSNMWNQSNVFNWTMTYDRSISDIHLPYGKINAKTESFNINIQSIMQKKNKTALIILSHCTTPAERLRYIHKLKEYIDVDVLGGCGAMWNCGNRFIHDNCFELMNSYKFYLAFENSFCNNYFTEKIFENFDYDTVLVSRGGLKGQSRQFLPEGTFIPADDFANAKELGMYLKHMPQETYINILERKIQYTSLNSYTSAFHNAMCDICCRMNNLNLFKNVIRDMEEWALSFKPCKLPGDLE